MTVLPLGVSTVDTPRLSHEQLTELVARMHAGDRAARERLASDGLRLIAFFVGLHVARYPGDDREELEAEAAYEMARCLDRFDPTLGNLSAFVRWACVRGFSAAQRRRQRDRRLGLCSLDAPAADGLPLRDAIAGSDDPDAAAARAQRHEAMAALRRALPHLTDRQREILTGRYFEGRSTSDLGEALGVSIARVGQIERKAVQKLRQLLTDAPKARAA